MLGIVFIYFIGKYFYELAISFNKNKWVYAVLGVLSYYGGTLVMGVALGILDGLFAIGIDWDDNFYINLLAIPFGIGSTYLFYYLLKRKWSSEEVDRESIEDIGKKE